MSKIHRISTGPLGWTTTLTYIRDPLHLFRQAVGHPVSKMRLGGKEVYVVGSNDLAIKILKGNHPKSPGVLRAAKAIFDYKPENPPVLLADDPKARAIRAKLQPALTPKALMDSIGDIQIAIEKAFSGINGLLDIGGLADQAAANVVMQLMTGGKMDSEADLVQAVDQLVNLVTMKVKSPWKLLSPQARKANHLAKATVIQQARDIVNHGLANLVTEAYTLLERLLGTNPTDSDIETAIQNVIAFLLAGQETTGSGFKWTLIYLAQNPKILAAVVNFVRETDDVMGMCQSGPLIQAILEALRLIPSVPTMGRQISTPLNFQDFQFPTGSVFLIPPWTIHRDPNIWTTPDEFRPDRFDGMNVHQIINLPGYLTFGAFHRICPGQSLAIIEIALMLIYLLRNFEVKVMQPHNYQVQALITLGVDRAVMAHISPAAN